MLLITANLANWLINLQFKQVLLLGELVDDTCGLNESIVSLLKMVREWISGLQCLLMSLDASVDRIMRGKFVHHLSKMMPMVCVYLEYVYLLEKLP